MRVLSIVGARPQFVKLAPLSTAFGRAGVESLVVHTGQHYDHGMSQAFFDEYGMPEPWRNLGVGSGPVTEQTAQMLTALGEVLEEAGPDVVLVPGDTTSTLAGALAAAQLGLPLAHVEAGLRSFVRTMPEERNRVVTDHLADALYAPSAAAMGWLAAEGLAARAVLVGDVMRDVVESVAGGNVGARQDVVVATVHRPRNADDPDRLARIMAALGELAAGGLRVVLPLHPRTARAFGPSVGRGVEIVDPLPHGELLALVATARAVVTDSGGLQKEAYWSRTPCVTLRSETEWVETVEEGWNVLVDADARAIVQAVQQATCPPTDPDAYGRPGAAERIVADLVGRFS